MHFSLSIVALFAFARCLLGFAGQIKEDTKPGDAGLSKPWDKSLGVRIRGVSPHRLVSIIGKTCHSMLRFGVSIVFVYYSLLICVVAIMLSLGVLLHVIFKYIVVHRW